MECHCPAEFQFNRGVGARGGGLLPSSRVPGGSPAGAGSPRWADGEQDTGFLKPPSPPVVPGSLGCLPSHAQATWSSPGGPHLPLNPDPALMWPGEQVIRRERASVVPMTSGDGDLHLKDCSED